MPIYYALVARGKNVLAEYTNTRGNFPTVTRVVLSKIPDQDGKMSYVYDNYVYHYIVDSGIIFLCMSDEHMKRRITFAFLDEIKTTWRQKYGQIEQTAIAFSLNDQFSPYLRDQIEVFNTNPTPDNISRVKTQIDSVKDVMVDNIERVMERGEKIELLVDKTDRLNQQAFKFERTSRVLKTTMYCRKLKLYALIFFVVALIIFFIVMIACGVDFKQCK